jgi:hypothetical protein
LVHKNIACIINQWLSIYVFVVYLAAGNTQVLLGEPLQTIKEQI